VADSVPLPQLVYNIPGRSAVNIAPETLARLARHENVVGVKEASGSLDQVSRVIESCDPAFSVLSGDDSLTLPILAVGGRGVIAVISNVVPAALVDLVRAALAGDYAKARSAHYALLPLMRAMGLETNPIPVKAALAALGQIENELRLPLTPLSEPFVGKLRAELERAKLL
jgi:4-hydroxy-tetrahydrodipicolinate synthase